LAFGPLIFHADADAFSSPPALTTAYALPLLIPDFFFSPFFESPPAFFPPTPRAVFPLLTSFGLSSPPERVSLFVVIALLNSSPRDALLSPFGFSLILEQQLARVLFLRTAG